MYRAIGWGWNRFRPQEGWLAFFLLAAAIACLNTAVLEVEWITQDTIIIPASIGGLLMGVGLAKRPLAAGWAWFFITIYGLVTTTLQLIEVWPSLETLSAGWWAVRHHWYQQGALFLDKMGSWLKAAVAGDSSQETIAFAFGLGLLAWLLAAYAGWRSFRHRRPLPGLVLMSVAVALNGYFGEAPFEWIAGFIGAASLTAAVIHFADLEQGWHTNGVDYSPEIRIELTLYAGGIVAVLIALAFVLPAFSITRLSRFFLQQPVVQEAEETLARVFGGVRQPRLDAGLPGPGGPGGRGVLPRSYLLGDAPELQETIVMTAVVTPPLPPQVTHWRGLSYDVYTGRGWALSEERQEPFTADSPLPLPTVDGQTTFEQSIYWLFDERVLRYSIGFPLTIDQAAVTHWRGLTDLVRIQSSDGPQYHITSQATTASPELLQQTLVEDVPSVILTRYTQLPADLPERVHQLAQEVAGDQSTPYAQALALEQFLRQYTYSLDVALPPSQVDPVDYFLFEQQAGYCDYYASAMTVMARSVGLPARIAIGFLAQPPDEKGVQTIRQIHGHSWTEVYFAGYGWVAFEPTAAFAAPRTQAGETPAETSPDLAIYIPDLPYIDATPVPLPEPTTRFPWERLAVVGVGGALLLFIWWRQQNPTQEQDEVLWVFARLRYNAYKLGHPTPPSQTPTEFTQTLLVKLESMAQYFRLEMMVRPIYPHIQRLTTIFNYHQYNRHDAYTYRQTVLELWRKLKRPFWLLRLLRRIRRPNE